MAIYDPTPFLSRSDKELIQLLAQLIVEQEDHDWNPNRDRDFAALSDQDAIDLLELLEEFVNSKRAIESAYLIEQLFGGETYDDKVLRNIYFGWRKIHGKSRAVATVQWRNFLSRLGALPVSKGDVPYWYVADATPMTMNHFFRMESKLADSTGLKPRVKILILEYVRSQFNFIEAVRGGNAKLNYDQILIKPRDILSDLKIGRSSKVGTKPIATTKLSAVMTIVMDVGALYTTRDWSVAGFMSTIAGAAPPTLLD